MPYISPDGQPMDVQPNEMLSRANMRMRRAAQGVPQFNAPNENGQMPPGELVFTGGPGLQTGPINPIQVDPTGQGNFQPPIGAGGVSWPSLGGPAMDMRPVPGAPQGMPNGVGAWVNSAGGGGNNINPIMMNRLQQMYGSVASPRQAPDAGGFAQEGFNPRRKKQRNPKFAQKPTGMPAPQPNPGPVMY